jgi:hypothetical protein
VDLNGGICFLHYDKDHNERTTFTDGKYLENVNFSEFDIIPDDPLAFSLIRKIQSTWTGKFVGDVAWARKPFGLETNYFQKNKGLGDAIPNVVPCLSRYKITKYILKDKITKNADKIESWKVSVPKAVGGSKRKRRSTVPLNQIFLVDKGTITTETYNIIDIFSHKNHAENFILFLKTDFARYLVGLRKITQDLPPNRWNWVPYMDVNKQWTDEELFDYFNITSEEQTHIKNKVKEWS